MKGKIQQAGVMLVICFTLMLGSSLVEEGNQDFKACLNYFSMGSGILAGALLISSRR